MSCGYDSHDVWVPIRGSEIPATIVAPRLPPGEKAPLVAYVHGFAGSRQEGGGAALIAETLAGKGIASVRMDFAGCGDSRESAVRGSLSDMAGDVSTCCEYALEHFPIDRDRLGMIGNSLGGRVALEVLAAGAYPASTVLLMAPAVDRELMPALFDGPDAWERARAIAKTEGFYRYTTVFGVPMELGPGWFSEMAGWDSYERLQHYGGRMRVLYAEDDDVIPREVCERCARHYGAEFLLISGGGHTFGFYTGQNDIRDRLAAHAAQYFADAFRP